MFPLPKLPFPNVNHVFWRCLVQSQYRLTPVAIAKRDAMERVRIEHGPITLQSHAVVPQRPADYAIAAALVFEQGKPFFGDRRLIELAMGGCVTVYQSLDCCAAHGESRTAIGEPCLDIAIVVMAPRRW